MFLLPFLNDLFIKKAEKTNCQLDQLLDDGYCIIYVKSNSVIYVCFIFNKLDKSSICHINFCAVSSSLLINLISQHKSLSQVISISHALYLGKEIYKAELSNICSQAYIQS